MAMVIKALLASECAAKIYLCAVVFPIKSMYFLYGWQPESLIRLALWLRQISLPTDSNPGEFNPNMTENYLQTTLDTSSTEMISENNQNNNHSESNLKMTSVQSENRLQYEIAAVCALPNSLDFFGNYSSAAFTMLTTIIR